MNKNHPLKRLEALVKRFRLLDGWTIEYDERSEYKGQCAVNEENKRATIYAWGKGPEAPDYLLHELLHCAIRSLRVAKDKRAAEETLVQDICKLVHPKGELKCEAVGNSVP